MAGIAGRRPDARRRRKGARRGAAYRGPPPHARARTAAGRSCTAGWILFCVLGLDPAVAGPSRAARAAARYSAGLVRCTGEFSRGPYAAACAFNGGQGLRKLGIFHCVWLLSAMLTVSSIACMMTLEDLSDEVWPMMAITGDAWRPRDGPQGEGGGDRLNRRRRRALRDLRAKKRRAGVARRKARRRARRRRVHAAR